MADDNHQTLIDTLRRENDRLSTKAVQLAAEAARRKDQAKAIYNALGVSSASDLADSIATLRTAGGLKKILGERDQFKAAASTATANPSDLQRELEATRGELRTIKHREGLKGLYADADLGLNPAVPVDRLEAILGYKPEGDTFDGQAVKTRIAALKTTDPYLFAQASQQQQGQGQQQQQTAQTPPPWGGRGASVQSVTGHTLTEAQLRDPAFMIEQAAKVLAPAK
jgi:hypothetical protein